MTSPDPTPAEIEAAAREWCIALGLNPDGRHRANWMHREPEAHVLITLRAKDKARIAELEAKNLQLRELVLGGLGAVSASYLQAEAEHRSHDRRAAQYDTVCKEWRAAARAALAAAPEKAP